MHKITAQVSSEYTDRQFAKTQQTDWKSIKLCLFMFFTFVLSHSSSSFKPLEPLSIDTQTDLFVHWRVHFCRFLFARTVRWTGGGGTVWWTGGHFTLPGSRGTYVDIVVGGRYSLQTNFTVNKHWTNLIYTNK